MKKIICLLTIMTLGILSLQAQETTRTSGKTSFGIRGGVNFQNINGKDMNDNKLDNDILSAFHAGITVDIPIATDFYFQTALLYSMKGAKSKNAFLGQPINSEVNISYIEIPLNLLYKPMLGNGHMLLGFGPYAALGVNGKVKYSGGNSSVDRDIKFQNKVSLTDANNVAYIRPVDAGANLLIGYEFASKFSFQLNAQLGLLNINPEYQVAVNDKTAARNTGFGLSVGYKF